jgi:hypothetical protein
MTKSVTLTAAILLAVLPVPSVFAQAPAGPEFRVNTGTTTVQARSSSVAADPAGGFVVAWATFSGGAGGAVRAQLFDVRGVRRGAELQVSTSTSVAVNPAAGFAADGRFVIVWTAVLGLDSADVRGRRFAATGTALGGEFLVNAYTTGAQGLAAIAVEGAGNFVTVWQGDGPSVFHGDELFGQRFDPNGVRLGGEFAVNTFTSSDQSTPSVAIDGAGNFVVVWSAGPAAGDVISGQRFAPSGARIGGEFQVNSDTSVFSRTPDVAAAPDGRFVVVWQDVASFPEQVRARRFDATGQPSGSEFVAHSLADVSFNADPVATMLASGAFVLQWMDADADTPATEIEARRFSADGSALGASFRVNSTTAGYQLFSDLSSDAAGNVASLWQTQASGPTWDVYAQRFGQLGAMALAVDTVAGDQSDGNRVLEVGEVVDLRPSWQNNTGAPRALPGTLSALTGPAGANYQITDGSGGYGTVPNGATQPCLDCYAAGVQASTRPQVHWDAIATELMDGGEDGLFRWPVHIGESFTDVARSSPYYRLVETLLHRGVTGGCGGGLYCPAAATTRAEMAVFLLTAREEPLYRPQRCLIGDSRVFADVPSDSPFCRWIEELARRGITGGCGGGNYCPTAAAAREQMAVFVLRTLDPNLNPPACEPPNMFSDVPETSAFCRWIEELARRGIVSGCGGGNYCPTAAVSREQMAVFLTGTFGLTLYGA